MAQMHATFYSSTTTPLYSTAWTPSGAGGYAGTCIFLIILAATLRSLLASKHFLERRWIDQARNRRYVTVAGQPTEEEKANSDPDSKAGFLLSERGVEEHVRVVQSYKRPLKPWRISTDVPRALLVTVIVGIAYLLYAFLGPPLLDDLLT